MRLGSTSGIVLAIAVACAASSSDARADGVPQAEVKFKEGVALLERADYDAACARFEESFALEPAPGTLFNLGKCHALRGELVRARGEFLDLAKRMDAAFKKDLAEKARASAAEVDAKIARVTLTKPPSTPIEVSVDGKVCALGAAPLELDPGKHTIEFHQDGRAYDKRELRLAAAEHSELEIPAPKSAPPKRATLDSGDATPGAWMKPTGIVVGAVGIVAVGVGVVFGVRTLSLSSDALDACGGSKSTCPNDAARNDAQEKDDDAHASATLSTIAIGGGLALVAGGVALYLLAPKPNQGSAAAVHRPRFTPWAAPSPHGATAGATLSF